MIEGLAVAYVFIGLILSGAAILALGEENFDDYLAHPFVAILSVILMGLFWPWFLFNGRSHRHGRSSP